ncbi:MAG: putative Fe-S cluster assembly protein SufT, partial [Acidobacteria bacterium]|nr:putative Fe-S cluster assembly protein SufT [Acidobacteriota bacterium]
MYETTELKRECDVIEIPSGVTGRLAAGTRVRIAQYLGNAYTIVTDFGYMCRLDGKDADALGLASPAPANELCVEKSVFSESMVWDQLKTVYDPEIPVN